MSATNQLAATSFAVTILRDEDNPAARFQAVTLGSGTTAPRSVYTCATQGAMTSWLVCNGYKWVKDSQPQQWIKA